jgi:iron(II)-dependent oxidoreductase
MRRFVSRLSWVPAAAGAFCWFAARPAAPSAELQRWEAAQTPPGFVYVPGGECVLGSNDKDADEGSQPEYRRFIPSFYIGRLEVSEAEWKRFRPAHIVAPGRENFPITNLQRSDVIAYCRWVGGYLPSDEEWEKAARGTDGRRYPWGNSFDPARCNLKGPRPPVGECAVPGERRGLRPVGGYAAGASPYGALQMSGNAWEWVMGDYRGNPQQHIIRGGAFGYSERDARTYHRGLEGAGVT